MEGKGREGKLDVTRVGAYEMLSLTHIANLDINSLVPHQFTTLKFSQCKLDVEVKS